VTADSIWHVLDIAPTVDITAIRRAYSRQLKAMDVDLDPGAFMVLREARDLAMEYAAEAGAASDAPQQAREAEPATDDGRESGFPAVGGAPVLSGWSEDAVSGSITATAPIGVDMTDYSAAADERVSIRETSAPSGSVIAEVSTGVPVLEGYESVQGVGIHRQSAPADLEERYQAFLALLFPPEERQEPHSAEEQAALAGHFEALLADPRMAEVAFYADAERWFSESLAKAVPWSDTILKRAAGFFGWLDRAGEINLTPAITFVTDRIGMLDFLMAVQTKGHPLNDAWRELRKPANESSRRGWVKARKIHELLALVRRDYPDLETCFDWYRVSLWENPSEPSSSWSGGWLFAFVAIQLLVTMCRYSGEQRPAPTPVPLSEPIGQLTEEVIQADVDADISFALDRLFGGTLTLAELQRRNPALYRTLSSNWLVARDGNADREQFVKLVDRVMVERAARGRGRLRGELLVDQRSVDLDQALILKARDVKLCDGFFHGREVPPYLIAADLRARQRALTIRTLLEVDGDPRPPGETDTKSFTLSGAMVEAVAKRAGMDPETLMTALNEGGTASQRCDARIALLATVLALPSAERLKLLSEI
jgi:hypothetical protein